MKIKHLLWILLTLLISLLLIPIYEYGYSIEDYSPAKLDDKFNPGLILLFLLYNTGIIIALFMGLIYIIYTYKIVYKIDKFLNKKIL